MKPALGRVLGLFIFLAVAGLAVAWKFLHRPPPQSAGALGEAATLHGKIGGEKAGFADDPQIASALAKYRITLDARKAGSVEMVRESTAGVDFLWPASQVNVEDFRSAAGGTPAQAEEVFHSPLVFYSWDVITDVLMTNGLVQKQGETYYLTELVKLIALVEQKKKWADLGLSQFYSSILIHTTDPARSNSGNTWAALLASTCNDGEVLTADKTLNTNPRSPNESQPSDWQVHGGSVERKTVSAQAQHRARAGGCAPMGQEGEGSRVFAPHRCRLLDLDGVQAPIVGDQQINLSSVFVTIVVERRVLPLMPPRLEHFTDDIGLQDRP